MFFLTYLQRELRQRFRQAVFIALGLALGVGLVMTATAASSGVKNAQASVLRVLYGVGTDVTVTRAWSAGHGGGSHLFTPKSTAQAVHLDFLADGNQGMFSSSSAASIAKLRGVTAAVSVLALLQTKMTIPAEAGAPAGTPSSGSAASTSASGPSSTVSPPTTTTVDGVDTARRGLGPLSQANVTSGRGLSASDAGSDVALVDSNYARANKLTAGSVMTLARVSFRVVGIVSQPAGTSPEILIPLARAQALSGLTNQVNTVDVATASAADVAVVSKEISRQLPWADVTNASSLASEITGSLASTARLATDLGRWVAVGALAAAFALAGLLTMSAVTRRVREFGTLKALGWRTRRIVAQVLGESVAVGIIGAAVGIGLGFGGAALISWLAPTLTATVAAAPGTKEPQGTSGTMGGSSTSIQHFTAPGSYNTVPIHFGAPVALSVIALAVALGIAGGLLAGALGGWRAARLHPATALAQVE